MSEHLTRRAERLRRRGRGYTRTVTAVLVALGVLAATLGVAGAMQGPRLVASVFGGGAQPRLTLTADQSLADVRRSQVEVQPAAQVQTTVSDRTIVVRFTSPLPYGTRFHVRVSGVRGIATGAASDFTASFASAVPETAVLVRDAAHGDSIRRAPLIGGGAGEVLFTAPRIQTYALLDDGLAVVTLDAQDHPTVRIVPTRGRATTLPLPGDGDVRDLRVAPERDLVGVVYSDPSHDNILLIADLADGTGLARPVTGQGGSPSSVLDWRFVPGTTSFVAQGGDSGLLLGDAVQRGALTPLGAHQELRDFLPGTATLVVADPDRVSALDLARGTTSVVTLRDPGVAGDLYPGPVVVLDAQGDSVQSFARLDYATSSFGDTFVQRASASGSTELFRPAGGGSRITTMCPSPNGEYLAVASTSTSSVADDYPGLPSFSGMTTTFVQVGTGRVTRSMQGFLPDWCGGG